MVISRNFNSFLKTALKRKKVSKPVRILMLRNLLKGLVLDFGCGNGDDYRHLFKQGYNVSAYDKYNAEYKREFTKEEFYNTLYSVYVFNVIPTLKEHQETLDVIKGLGENVFIAVRSDVKAIKTNWEYDKENLGYWTTNGSFQRFYDEEMIKDLFGEVEYLCSNKSLRLFKLKRESTTNYPKG